MLDPTTTHSPDAYIACIPDDVLHEIFYLVVASSRTLGEYRHTKQNGSGSIMGIALSHVCRYWRTMALSSPQLWTFFHIVAHTKPAMLREFLARSGMAPLTVLFEGPDTYWISVEHMRVNARILAPHAHRIAEFEATKLLQGDARCMLALFTAPAPCLRTLRLHVDEYMSEMEHIPVFAGQMPSLRNVSIDGLSLPWVPYSNLTSLVISHHPAPPLTELVSVLQHCPDLELLVLVLRVVSGDEDVAEPSPIALPRLQRLALEWIGDQHGIMHLLEHLSFPATAATELTFHGERNAPLDLTQHSPALRARVAAIRSAEVCTDDALGQTSVRLSASDTDADADRAFAVEWRWASTAGGAVGGFEHIGLAAVPLPALERLRLRDTGRVRYGAKWARVLPQIPPPVAVAVQLDRATDFVAHAFLAAIRPDAGRVACPRLVHLRIEALWIAPLDVLRDMVATFGLRGAQDVCVCSLHMQGTSQFKRHEGLVAELAGILGTVRLS
ncbi:hypothetical protein B0H21DRAFT_474686 [Amylocystis lapponica]|nr:hypothetical protein B0H21DRAFT_474686 [Amylocystis lapponica]